MAADVKLAHIASLLADPTRARIVMALMDGRARTAKELAYLSEVSAATASAHLAKLVGMKLVEVSPQGRHRYHRIASPRVAEMVEAIGAVAGETLRAAPVRGPADAAMLTARTCYDHLAGRLGVAVADSLQEAGHLALTADGGEVTPAGRAFLARNSIALDQPSTARRIFCRPCIDWTERRFHVAGHVGAAICACAHRRGWVRPECDSRALRITADGRRAFAEIFSIDMVAVELPRRALAPAAA
ncbi:helix-turn-helix domain-containing protein [soil metagenome]